MKQLLRATSLNCEYHENPLGVYTDRPRLSWKIEADIPHVRQERYRIESAGSAEELLAGTGLLLQTGWVESSENFGIRYPGKAPAPQQRIYWRVQVADQNGHESGFSEPAYFERPIEEWSASWISSPLLSKEAALRPAPLLRKLFTVDSAVEKARLYITARGLYIPHINGKRLDQELFTPGCTNYQKRILFSTYDLTPYLKQGENCLGAELSTGWYAGNYGYEGLYNIFGDTLALLAELHITGEDGSVQIIRTDESWESSLGPIVFSDIYYGESYDARKEVPGWDTPDADRSSWTPCSIEEGMSLDVVRPFDGEPVRRTGELKVQGMFTTPAGETVLDMGQNFVGWLKVRLSGKAGSVFSCDFAEVLDKDGNFYTDNLRITGMADTYTLKGNGEECFEPSFTFHGFRYVRILEQPGGLRAEDVTGIVINTDMKQIGSFSCSDPEINQLQQNIVWGQRGNFLDIPTDCPQRDERLGWTGDAQVFIKTGSYNYQVAAFFTKWLRDVASEQREDGNIPVVIPNVLQGQNHPPFGSAAWGDACIVCPWTIYESYGDEAILREHYPMMRAWNAYVLSKTQDYIWKNDFHFGDWLALDQPPDSPSCFGGTEKEQVATAFFAYATSLLVKVTEVLGEEDDNRHYRDLHQKICDSFYQEFVSRSGRVWSNTQTAYVHALNFDLLPEEERSRAAGRLVDDIRARSYHLSTGFTGTPYLLHVLSRFGYEDVAYRLLLQGEFPSWIYTIRKGATTIWERWDGIRPDGSFQTTEMNSFNHYAYGSVGAWMYEHILGYSFSAGCRTISFAYPEQCPLEYAAGSCETMFGLVSVSWKRTGEKILMEFEVPSNTDAELRISYESCTMVSLHEASEGEIDLLSLKAAKSLELGSGRYTAVLRAGRDS